MKKEKIIYNNESRLVRIDDNNNKYILYNKKKVYLEKKGGVGFILPITTPSFPTPNRPQIPNRTTARLTSVLSKTAKELIPAASAAINAYADADTTGKNAISRLQKS